ncbi:hypothetical protein RhiJN_26267 [Ceratobasidium sp. AG-Ba]|nr:hypothetical protein RhiJN_26267 [Ceratobasidium sp. AG-Ba]
MSFLLRGSGKQKVSTSRTYRTSRTPYPVASTSARTSSLLLSAPSAISGRTLDRRHKKVQAAYEESLQKYTDDQKKDIAALQGEITWTDSSSQVGNTNYSQTYDGNDSGEEEGWASDDDQPLRYLSLEVAERVGAKPPPQSWSERRERMLYSWEKEMESVCDALLAYDRDGPPSNERVPDVERSFSLLCIHLTTRDRVTFTGAASLSTVQILAQHGYIPPTPTNPSLAIHVDVLRYCMAFRKHAPIVSIQGITSAICDVHNNIYSAHLCDQISDALDVYLAFKRLTDDRLAVALSRDHPDYMVLKPTIPQLKDEPKLEHSMMVTCDGNDSLKRVAGSVAGDPRTFNHRFFLENDYVDRFENEAQSKGKKAGATKAGESSGSNTAQPNGPSGDTSRDRSIEPQARTINESTDTGDEEELPCEQRWKNAQADSHSGKPIVVFDETGIFVVSCRHGTVILVEDMRRSGELSKYGLAAVDRLV